MYPAPVYTRIGDGVGKVKNALAGQFAVGKVAAGQTGLPIVVELFIAPATLLVHEREAVLARNGEIEHGGPFLDDLHTVLDDRAIVLDDDGGDRHLSDGSSYYLCGRVQTVFEHRALVGDDKEQE